MVTLQILVLPFLVRIRVSQQYLKVDHHTMFNLFLCSELMEFEVDRVGEIRCPEHPLPQKVGGSRCCGQYMLCRRNQFL